MNIFLVGFIGVLFFIVFRTKPKKLAKNVKIFIKEFFTLNLLLGSLVYVFAIMWLIQIVMDYFKEGKDSPLEITMLFPSSIIPVPASIIIVLLPIVTSRQVVFPPKTRVSFLGTG